MRYGKRRRTSAGTPLMLTRANIYWKSINRRRCFIRWHWSVFNRTRDRPALPAEGAFSMERLQQAAVVTLALATCLASVAIAESRKEYRFNVGPNANISVDTQYGAISVKPGTNNQVVVTAISQSDKTEVDNQQRGNRIEIDSHLLAGADSQTGRVDYELQIPPDATLNLRSSTGPLSAQDLKGDL